MKYIKPTHDVLGLEKRIKVKIEAQDVKPSKTSGFGGVSLVKNSEVYKLKFYSSDTATRQWAILGKDGTFDAPAYKDGLGPKTIVGENELLVEFCISGYGVNQKPYDIFNSSGCWTGGSYWFWITSTDTDANVSSVSFTALKNASKVKGYTYRGVRRYDELIEYTSGVSKTGFFNFPDRNGNKVPLAPDPSSPRKVYRHANGKGSVIEFNMYGKGMKIFVPDAQYRPDNTTWGMAGQNIPELQNFDQDVKYVSNNGGNVVGDTVALPKVLTDLELQTEFPSFKADKTAKENTNILMKYDTPAAHAARGVNVGLGEMDLPNIYEAMVIFQESDRLDELDPTFETHKDKGLGYKASWGRFDMNNQSGVWSSTSYSDSGARDMSYNGYVRNYTRSNTYGVVPVLEL